MQPDKPSSDKTVEPNVYKKYIASYEQTCYDTLLISVRTAWGKITTKDLEEMQQEEI